MQTEPVTALTITDEQIHELRRVCAIRDYVYRAALQHTDECKRLDAREDCAAAWAAVHPTAYDILMLARRFCGVVRESSPAARADAYQLVAHEAQNSRWSHSHEPMSQICGVVTAHMRFLGASVRRADLPPSRHIGAVGEAVELTVVVERVRELPTQWGAMNIIVMRGEDGAVVVWKTGSRSAAPGARFRLSGKVKAHSEFGGEAQTEVVS